MRRLAMVLLILAIPIFLTACGGGGSSSSSSSTSSKSPRGDENAWAAEVQAVMGESGKTIEAAEGRVNAAKTRNGLEAAYRSYAGALSTVVSGFRATQAPKSCESLKSHIVGFLGEFASITGELGHQTATNEKQFDSLVKQDTAAGQAFAGMMERIGSQGHC